jgi:nicotinamidase-related amidase
MHDKPKRALVIVDPQNDFCDERGSLYVDGAEADMKRLSEHIAKSGDMYTDILVSLDSHDTIAIFHPKFWAGENGLSPKPFTAVSEGEFSSGKWMTRTRSNEKYAAQTFAAIRGKGMDSITIWPEHCVVSTWGHQINEGLQNALRTWRERTGQAVRYVFKGENPYTDQLSIFEGLDDSWPQTAFNEDLFSYLRQSESVVFSGEALSHCVEASILSYVRRLSAEAQSVSLLADCSSPVSGFDRGAALEKLSASGVAFVYTG